jgi:hypothetical protein
MSEIPNFPEASWSTTRQASYDACPRQYYYQYYASWQGWPKGNRFHEQESRLAYFWSKRETIPTWTGKHVHDAIAQCLNGQSMQEVAERTLRSVSDDWHRSDVRGKAFRQRGADACNYPKEILLMEHTEKDLPDEVLDDVSAKISDCLQSFSTLGIASEFHAACRDSNRYCFAEHPGDKFVPRTVDFATQDDDVPLKIWSMLDCAYEIEKDRCVVYDWKTGQEPKDRGEAHLTDQLVVYAHYVLGPEGMNRDAGKIEIEAFEVYLPSCNSFGGAVTFGELEDARERICRKARDLRSLHNLIREQGSLVCQPMSSQQVCVHCPFRSICAHVWKREE